MPSPFSGMDPYLDHPETFPGLRHRLVTYLSEALQPLPVALLRGPGTTDLDRGSERYVGPDVNVLEQRPHETKGKRGKSAVATASRTNTNPLVIHVAHDERREPFVEICLPHWCSAELSWRALCRSDKWAR